VSFPSPESALDIRDIRLIAKVSHPLAQSQDFPPLSLRTTDRVLSSKLFLLKINHLFVENAMTLAQKMLNLPHRVNWF
jgi:hypothetical protein